MKTYGECRAKYGTITFKGVRYIRLGPPKWEEGDDWYAPVVVDYPEILDWPVIDESDSAYYNDRRCRPDAKALLDPDYVVSEDCEAEYIAMAEVEMAMRDYQCHMKDSAAVEVAAEVYRTACATYGVNPTWEDFVFYAFDNYRPVKKYRKFRQENPDHPTVRIVESFPDEPPEKPPLDLHDEQAVQETIAAYLDYCTSEGYTPTIAGYRDYNGLSKRRLKRFRRDNPDHPSAALIAAIPGAKVKK